MLNADLQIKLFLQNGDSNAMLWKFLKSKVIIEMMLKFRVKGSLVIMQFRFRHLKYGNGNAQA